MSQWSGWHHQCFEASRDHALSYHYLPNSNFRTSPCDQLGFEQGGPQYWVENHQYIQQHTYEHPYWGRQPSPQEQVVSHLHYWDDNSSCASSHACEDNSPPIACLRNAPSWGHARTEYTYGWSGNAGVNPTEILHKRDSLWGDNQHESMKDSIDQEPKAQRCSIEGLNIESPPETSHTLPDYSPALTPHARNSFSDTDSDSEYEPPAQTRYQPHIRQRAYERVSKSRPQRVSKPRQGKKGSTIAAAPQHSKSRSSLSSNATKEAKSRHFSCPLFPYGCSATFATKNEWKRHFLSHLLLDYFRCDLCQNTIDNPNDFNRKDLFLQHLRRMHIDSANHNSHRKSKGNSSMSKRQRSSSASDLRSPTCPTSGQEQDKICSRCYVFVHDPPAEAFCVLCSETFTGPQSCKAWLEHVGKHIASMGKDKQEMITIPWDMDKSLRHWLQAAGIIVPADEDDHWQLADDTYHIKANAFARKANIAVGNM